MFEVLAISVYEWGQVFHLHISTESCSCHLIWAPRGLASDILCFGKMKNRLQTQSNIRPCCRQGFCLRSLMEFLKNAPFTFKALCDIQVYVLAV